ncbi:hypothetical protein PCANC_06227 [Puccinia coronata f. sp. avenae]|uniref:CRAL-TRIO domain-containing protein n=1 Tax=Puccinia coronata f. sp. avenae TaxID=200324 RepID=A0A2N5V354_9BASI|nr:hypothetical protein PCANC_17986 [Puccinia coronata f. sp. avenae]PLW24140.1 hypothetical protein PCASD_06710 [Puccinia coronata f. sp. avenae]PLW37852.1 hypothetical protein PCASD_05744 [Puccinia coronata f. sp. avenae]PLW44430.1 hypothetical protein PCANC_06227 [Puccinia coronata f. sp. avenae]
MAYPRGNQHHSPTPQDSSASSTPSDKPKKRLPSYWKTLKHPSPDSSPLPLPNDPLESFTDQQKSTYDFILNTLSSPDFQLPIKPSPSTAEDDDTEDHQDQNVSNKLTQAEKSYCSREAILRICRATKWDQQRALKRLVDTLVWRREFKVDQINHMELSYEAETGKQFTLGYDKYQRPILYMFPYRQNTKPSTDQIKLLVWYLERTIDLMPPGVESLTLIIDFGSSEKNKNSNSQPTSISVAKEVLKILQTYYCERLGQAICINVPWVFWGFLKLLKPFMDPKTVEKVLFDPVVTDYVPAEQLLKEGFHGSLDFEYEHEVYYKLLAELTSHRKEKMLARYERYGKGMIGMSEFEMRGGNRRAKGRRGQSIGSSSTAISSCTLGSASSSAMASGAHLKTQHRSSQCPSNGHLLMNSSDARTITSKPHRSSRPVSYQGSGKQVQLADIVELVSSRPLSRNTFSLPVPEPVQPSSPTAKEETGRTCFFARFQPKFKRKDKHETDAAPIHTPPPSPRAHKRHTISHSHRFQTLNAFGAEIQQGEHKQADHLSCSRRVTGVVFT